MRMVEPIGARRHRPQRSLMKSSKAKSFSKELEDKNTSSESQSGLYASIADLFEHHDVILQLKRNGLKRLQARSLYFSDMHILSDETKKRELRRVCPECQLIYKKNAIMGREVTPYIHADQRVKISI